MERIILEDTWEQAKAKYSLCNRCTKQPNCDDGKRNLYMNECSRFVDVVDMPQADGEKTCGTCRNEDTYHCAECENKSDYEQVQADGDLISRQAVIDSLHNKFTDGFDSDRWWNSMSVLYAINKVPSVKPQEPKTGHWIYKPKTDLSICDKCGSYCPHDKYGRIETDFCPHCGARMVEPQERSE